MSAFEFKYVQDFAEIEQEFLERVNRVIWCSAATVDENNRPRSRVLHPLWEGNTGWIGTFRQSKKSQHLARVPYMSLAYIADPMKPVYVDCLAEWQDDPRDKQRFWDWVQTIPEPLGYNPADSFTFDDTFGVLKLTPTRIEVYHLAVGSKIWKPV